MSAISAGARHLPPHHVTIRVPWHDGGWAGTVYARPLDNSSRLILPRIGERRRDEVEARCAGRRFYELDRADLPPCVNECVSFMAHFGLTRTMAHPYTGSFRASKTMCCHPHGCLETEMSRDHVSHREIAQFAESRVNLPKVKANEHRAQARRLREKLETYLAEHPDFTLRKMLLSGSLAKGTALRSLNDIDIACYVSGAEAPTDIDALLNYIAERLRKAFPNFSPDQVQPQTFSVTVSFKGSGLDVDVVPILYEDDPQWYGELVSQDDGSLLKTSIPLHLEFAEKRKKAQEKHFAQVVRIVKFWARQMKLERDGFRFKSFMIEMILAKLCDDGLDFSDYPEALQHFFSYVARTDLRERIVFCDYYKPSSVDSFNDEVQIIDPVNAKNNVARLYTAENAEAIVDATLDAGDAIDAALRAPTKELTVAYWQKVFGSAFQA